MSVKLKAVQDLLGRYRAVFRESWRHRKQMDPPVRTRHEAQFLPATLALRETPVHPAPRVAMWLILLFAALALCWAVFGHVDVVATASGKIVPDSHTKVIQPLEVGKIRAIHVRDGQSVKASDRLIDLDETVTAADTERLRSDLLSTRLEIGRNNALQKAQETGTPPIIEDFPEGQTDALRIRAEQRLVSSQYEAYVARMSQLEAEIATREAERRATAALVSKLRETLPIVRTRAKDYRNLLDRQFVSRHGYLELEQTRIEMERDLVAQQERLAQIEASRTEAERQMTHFAAETRREWLDRLHEAEQRAAVLAQELIKAESRGRLMMLTSPVDGIVQQLAVHTVGGVVTPAQALMLIVPGDAPLEVEAFLPNKDVGFVHPGQMVEAKVETFSFTKYGTIDGEIVHVSSDAIQDEKLGLVFAVRVRLADDRISVEGRPVRLSPGMAVTVEIKTGKRRLIEYFLGPLLQYADESLRER